MSTLDLSLLILLGAVGGGVFGAAIGALPAFVFTGFTVIAGVAIGVSTGDYDFLGNVAFGPVFGPHIAFSGGVAAAAFAKRMGYVDDAKDIATPMVSLTNPAVLLVGGLFGLIGHIGQQIIDGPLAGVEWTDGIALMVAISNIIARLVFGSSGLFGKLSDEARQRGRFMPGGGNVWVPHQQPLVQAGTIGLGSGLIASWMVITGWQVSPEVGDVMIVAGFGISAASLLFLALGMPVMVTHHMTLPAAVAAFQMVEVVGIAPEVAIFVGTLFGIIGALLGEFFSRLFLIHGDTFIDPPANAIWAGTTLAIGLGFVLTL